MRGSAIAAGSVRAAAVGAALLAGPALAGTVVAAPTRGSGPAVVHGRTTPAVVTWSGGPADVEVAVGTGWRSLGTGVASPFTAPELAEGALLRITPTDGPTAEVTFHRLWTPADVAAWSGAGLRGAAVTALATADDQLWTATDGGGVGWWDGTSWRHLDRRAGLPAERVLDLAVQGDARWAATDGALVALTPDGATRAWSPGAFGATRIRAVRPDGDDAAWVITDAGVARLDPTGVVAVVTDPTCTDVLPGDPPIAACAVPRALPDGTPVDGLVPAGHLTARVPRVDGDWLGTDATGLRPWVGGALGAGWTPAHGVVRDVARVEVSMVVAAGVDGTWIVRDDAVLDVPAVSGIPGSVATVVAPGPTAKRAWVGTSTGVALVSLSGQATPLPLAPLPAGVAVRSIRVVSDALVVASARGLVWVGPKPPRGWDTLVAAAGPDVRDALPWGRDWWALTAEAAFRLDRRGRLERFALGAPGVGLASTGAAVGVATEGGVRWWLPGARMLSAADRQDGLRGAEAAGAGALWLWTDHLLTLSGTLSQRSWAVRGVHDVAPLGAGVVLATDDGLAWLAVDDDAPAWGWADVATGAMVAVDAPAGRVWAVGADGRLWVGTEDGPAMVPLPEAGVAARQVVADADGAWVVTDLGLYRVSTPAPPSAFGR